MILSSGNSERTAVFFIQDGELIRQMRYSEFEAILDHVGAVAELADSCAKAIFVDINGHLEIVAAVFFLLRFDADGYADPEWNIPLPLLANQAERGPDLGDGPIRLVTQSRCAVSWHQDQLWDPPLAGESGPFEHLVAAVRENRLGLSIVTARKDKSTSLNAADGIPVLESEQEHSEVDSLSCPRRRLAKRLWRMRRKASAARAGHQGELAQLHSRYRQQLQQLEQTTSELQRKLGDEQRINTQLKQSVDAQAEHFGKMRQLISSQIGKIEDGARLGEQLGKEFNVKLDAATAELQEALERKDVDIFYRDGEIKCLGEKISELEQQKLELQQKLAGSDFLKQMSDAGIFYVASQPGAGEFRLPKEDIPAYLQSPEEYAAKFCYVDIQLYREWLQHDARPLCSKRDEGGAACGLPVHRVSSPATFEPGESDRCSQHKSSSLTLRQVIREHGS